MINTNAPDILFPHLGIVIQTIKDHITVFNFDVMFYGIIIGLGVIAGMFITVNDAKRRGQNQDDYWDCFSLMLILGVIGARLYYVAFSWDYYSANLKEIINLRGGGLAIYGGIIGGMLGILITALRKKRNFFEMMDSIMPSLMIGQAVGRWGNFFNCEAFGEYTDSLFAMRIKESLVSSSSVTELMKANRIIENGASYIQVHPTFLYESVWNLCSFVLVSIYARKFQKFKGEILCAYMVLYGTGRSIIEGLRTDSLYIGSTGIRVSQALSVTIAVAGLAIIIVNRLRIKKAGNNSAADIA